MLYTWKITHREDPTIEELYDYAEPSTIKAFDMCCDDRTASCRQLCNAAEMNRVYIDKVLKRSVGEHSIVHITYKTGGARVLVRTCA